MTRFSIITPAYRGAAWLPLCLASVADQAGVEVEHIVQDACSDDGTAEILARHPHVRAYVEKDDGMYDAINRGLRRATGDVLAWLNCDEQYLPGALSAVAKYFDAHPEADFAIGNMVIVNGEGDYICSRKMLPPLAIHTRVCHLSSFSCGLFFRRKVIDEAGLFFDTSWKAVGDAVWVLRALERGLVMQAIGQLTSTFTDHGENLGGSEQSEIERIRLRDSAPVWQRQCIPLIAAHHRVRRWLGGVYHQEPFRYKIYTRLHPDLRQTFDVARPTTIWKQRLTLLR